MSTVWSHVALNCRDVAATETFYRRWFGFRRVRVVAVPGGAIVFLRSGGALLELFPADTDPAGAPGSDGSHAPATVRHIAFQTDDVDTFLRGMGDDAEITLGPLDFGAVIPGWRTAWLSDPDGVVVEISQGFTDDPSTDQISINHTDDVKESV